MAQILLLISILDQNACSTYRTAGLIERKYGYNLIYNHR